MPRVSSESLCFCNGVGKLERLKASIYSSMSVAMFRLSCSETGTASSAFGNSYGGEFVSGTGFLIHCGLLLTTHVNLPSVSAAQSAEVRLHNGVAAALFPHRFFITSSVLDLTIVSIDSKSNNSGDSNSKSSRTHHHHHHFRIPNLNLGNTIYLLGDTRKGELTIVEGRVVIATDNLIKLSTNGSVSLNPGAAGFDSHGNLAFIICHPMRLASNTAKSSLSSTSWNSDLALQFGIPLPVIYDWLNQHWDNSLVFSPSHHHHHHNFSCGSFNMRHLFRSSEMVFKSQTLSLPRSSCHIGSRVCDENTSTKQLTHPQSMIHSQGIPKPQLYESPRVSAVPIQRKDDLATLLGMSIPSSVTRSCTTLPRQSDKRSSEENIIPVKEEASSSFTARPHWKGMVQSSRLASNRAGPAPARISNVEEEIEEVGSSKSVNHPNGLCSEVESSSPPPARVNNSEVESMCSAETAESSNCRTQSDKATAVTTRFHQAARDRSQGYVNHGRLAADHKYPIVVGRKSVRPDQQRRHTTSRSKRSCSGGSTSELSSEYVVTPTLPSTRRRMSGKLELSRRQGSTPPIGGGGIKSRKSAV